MFRWLLTRAQKEELRAQAIAYARTAEFRQDRDRALKAAVVASFEARLGPKAVYVLEWRYGMISEVRGVFSTPEGAWAHASRKEDPAYLVHKFDLDQGHPVAPTGRGDAPTPVVGGVGGLGTGPRAVPDEVPPDGGGIGADPGGLSGPPGRKSEVDG